MLSNDSIDVSYRITLSAGGSAAIVNFIVMDGTDTGSVSGASASSLATDIDTEAAKIWTNFRTDNQYRDGMTQAQIDAIKNF